METEAFYERVHDQITIVMGDFNAKVGKEGVDCVTGDFGLGEKNERFAYSSKMPTTNYLPGCYSYIVRNQTDLL